MSIFVVCPDCSKEYNVSDDRAGTKFRCKVCQGVVPVVELEDSPLTRGRKDKVVKQQKQAAKRSKQVKQNLTQLAMVLVGLLILGGIGLAATMFPAFREAIAYLLILTGVVCFFMGWWGILSTEEEPLLRLLIRYFPVAIFITILMRLNETWPLALRALGGAVAGIFGYQMLGVA